MERLSTRRIMWISLAGVGTLAAIWGVVLWRMHTASPAITEATISINQQSIDPAVITVDSGAVVAITNRDTAMHSLAADTTDLPGFTTQEPLNQDDSLTYTFDQKGTYRFYDPANPSKYRATVVVE